jgi:hypothetical protein
MNVPVEFSWEDARGRRASVGFTRDLSIRGTFVLAGKCPPVGTAVRMQLLLPPLVEEDQPLHWESLGRVLRVQERGPEGADRGFAVSCDKVVLKERG